MQVDKIDVRPLNHFDRLSVKEVQTESQIDYRPNNTRLLERMFAVMRPVSEFTRKLKRSLRVVLPEVDAMAQPVVIVFTRRQQGLPTKDSIGDGRIAPVVSKDEGRRGGVQGVSR